MSASILMVDNNVLPDDARAVLLSRNNDGSIRSEVVDGNSDVLNIERDLCKHMMDYPYTDAWLLQVRNAIDQRLASRQEAKASGSLSVPTKDGTRRELAVLVDIHHVEPSDKGELQ